MSSWVLAIWERGVLVRRVKRLETLFARWQSLYEMVKRSNQELIAENRRCGQQIVELETQHNELIKALQHYEDAEKAIDPNAKCPGCGHRKGHLTSLFVNEEFRVVNNCEVCGMTFVSAIPVAGEERARTAFQPMPPKQGA